MKFIYIKLISVKNLQGLIFIKDNKVIDANLSANFENNKNIIFSIETKDNGEKITKLYSSKAKPLVKRYKFIKGFDEGYLDFVSTKKNEISMSNLKIFDFKLKEVPALTKLLTLASLQGIADILTGEGIRFDEFEMKFNNQKNLMTIDELYAIGPAISILMSGYIEEEKLISLRGTLVPATTINKTISKIPLLGKILVGDKTGEGVFGVSFKIKGPPKDLETTVNPIKTLTPRFITRTLEKIKKN
jgi:Predicted membrane protein